MKVLMKIARRWLPTALVLPFGVALLGDPGADMSVSVLADKRHASAGEVVTYTVRVKNIGGATATNVVVCLVSPDNMQSSGGCVDAVNLGPGAMQTLTEYLAALPCGLPNTRKAKVTVWVSADNDVNSANDSDAWTITLGKCDQP